MTIPLCIFKYFVNPLALICKKCLNIVINQTYFISEDIQKCAKCLRNSKKSQRKRTSPKTDSRCPSCPEKTAVPGRKLSFRSRPQAWTKRRNSNTLSTIINGILSLLLSPYLRWELLPSQSIRTPGRSV